MSDEDDVLIRFKIKISKLLEANGNYSVLSV